MTPTQSQIGSWLSAAREHAGLSQEDAAAFLRALPGLEKTRAGKVSRWERGKNPMPADAFLALVVHYKADILDLLSKKSVRKSA